MVPGVFEASSLLKAACCVDQIIGVLHCSYGFHSLEALLLELVSKELNHLAAILHAYAGGLNFMNKKKLLLFFKKKMEILLHF